MHLRSWCSRRTTNNCDDDDDDDDDEMGSSTIKPLNTILVRIFTG